MEFFSAVILAPLSDRSTRARVHRSRYLWVQVVVEAYVRMCRQGLLTKPNAALHHPRALYPESHQITYLEILSRVPDVSLTSLEIRRPSPDSRHRPERVVSGDSRGDTSAREGSLRTRKAISQESTRSISRYYPALSGHLSSLRTAQLSQDTSDSLRTSHSPRTPPRYLETAQLSRDT